MLKGIGITLVSLAGMLFPIYAQAATPDEFTPNEFIIDAVKVLAERMEGRRNELSSDHDALYALIDEVLLPRLDREESAKQVLAKHWNDASEDQRLRFIAAFYVTLLRRYADGILDFEHDRVKVLKYRGSTKRRRVVVKTTVDLENGDNVSVNYMLIRNDSGWMMFDVIIEGVSFVQSFSVEFGEEIRATSLETVISRLETKANGAAGE